MIAQTATNSIAFIANRLKIFKMARLWFFEIPF